MSYSKPGRTANETPHITEHPGETIVCSEQSMWHEEAMHNNPFIDQRMDYNTTTKNDETSETSNGDSEKEKFRKFLYARAVCVQDHLVSSS